MNLISNWCNNYKGQFVPRLWAKFVCAEFATCRVCYGPSVSCAEFAMCRVVPKSFICMHKPDVDSVKKMCSIVTIKKELSLKAHFILRSPLYK